VKLRSLLPTLALCITLPADPVAAGPAQSVMPGVVPNAPKLDTPTQQRLRMRLKVESTTDKSQGAGNTEDEVYYAVAALPYTPGAAVKMKTVKRSGDPDIWQMGSMTAPTLHRTLFKGKSSALRENRFMLVVAEQDNSWIGFIETILSGGLATLQHAVDGDYGQPSQAETVVDELQDEFKAIVQRVAADEDQIIGALVITMKGSRLAVETDGKLFSTVLDDDPKRPVVKLFGGGSNYELTLYIEGAESTPPVAHDYFGLEEDDCGGDLWIETVDGNVQLGKGKRKGFVPKSHEWNWHCDGDEEITRASPATDYVIASRASSGDQILWRVFKDYTPAPDFTW
jgi:hypothetical protein